MSDRPILFSSAMVRALLEGRKTQTRRILTRQNADVNGSSWRGKSCPWEGLRFDEAIARENSPISGVRDPHLAVPFCHPDDGPTETADCAIYRVRPVIEIGAELWVRETIGRRPASFLGIEATNGTESAYYAADGDYVLDRHEFNICPWWRGKGSLPAIHMPRRASRLTLTVTDVRVQRLQEISEADCIAEGPHKIEVRPGIDRPRQPMVPSADPNRFGVYATPRAWYRELWDTINGVGAWEENPWIVALTFTVERRNIDA